eukprot:c28322_g1_i3 orf=411-677(+)
MLENACGGNKLLRGETSVQHFRVPSFNLPYRYVDHGGSNSGCFGKIHRPFTVAGHMAVLIEGLPNAVALQCLARVPLYCYPNMRAVCR